MKGNNSNSKNYNNVNHIYLSLHVIIHYEHFDTFNHDL